MSSTDKHYVLSNIHGYRVNYFNQIDLVFADKHYLSGTHLLSAYTMKQPILTPAQQAIIERPNVKALIDRFDCQIFSSQEAITNLKIHHRVASFFNTTPPPDLSHFKPLSNISMPTKPFVPDQPAPPGFAYNPQGKLILDKNWKQSGIKSYQLPDGHPDQTPF